MSVNWILPARGAGKGNAGNVKDGLAGALHNNGTGSMAAAISIRQDVMAAMRWVVGDRVLVGYDEAQKTLVMRRDVRGFKLTQPNQRKGEMDGKCMRAVVKVTLRDALPRDIFPFYVPLSECVIDGVDLHFQPKAGSA
jgi:hypothetical protein